MEDPNHRANTVAGDSLYELLRATAGKLEAFAGQREPQRLTSQEQQAAAALLEKLKACLDPGPPEQRIESQPQFMADQGPHSPPA